VTAGVTLLAAVGPLLLTGAIHAPLWLAALEPAIASLAFGFGLYCLVAGATGGWLPGRKRQRERERLLEREKETHERSSRASERAFTRDRTEELAEAVNKLADAVLKSQGLEPPTRAARRSPRSSKRGQPPRPPSQESGDTG